MSHWQHCITRVWASGPDLVEIRHATPVQRPACAGPPAKRIRAFPLFAGSRSPLSDGQIGRRNFGARHFGLLRFSRKVQRLSRRAEKTAMTELGMSLTTDDERGRQRRVFAQPSD